MTEKPRYKHCPHCDEVIDDTLYATIHKRLLQMGKKRFQEREAEYQNKIKTLDGNLETFSANAIERMKQLDKEIAELKKQLNQAKAEIVMLEKAKRLSCAEHGHDRSISATGDVVGDLESFRKLKNISITNDLGIARHALKWFIEHGKTPLGGESFPNDECCETGIYAIDQVLKELK